MGNPSLQYSLDGSEVLISSNENQGPDRAIRRQIHEVEAHMVKAIEVNEDEIGPRTNLFSCCRERFRSSNFQVNLLEC
jgi:hypothetical protein